MPQGTEKARTRRRLQKQKSKTEKATLIAQTNKNIYDTKYKLADFSHLLICLLYTCAKFLDLKTRPSEQSKDSH